MSDLHPTDDNLLDFVCKFLSDEETKELREHLRRCPMCDEAVLAVVRDRKRLRQSSPPEYVDGRFVDRRTNRLVQFVRSKRGLAAAATTAVIVLFAIVVPRISVPPEDFYWMPIELTASQFRDVSASDAMVCQEALNAYADHDAKQALVILEGVHIAEGRKDGCAIITYLLKASALLNTDDSEHADAILKRVQIESLPAPWRGRAGWLRYLALRDTGQSVAACSLLGWLADEQGEIAEQVQLELETGPCRSTASAGSL